MPVDSGNGTGRPLGGRRVPLLTHEQATRLAESLWGTGGTTSDRTDRDGVSTAARMVVFDAQWRAEVLVSRRRLQPTAGWRCNGVSGYSIE